MTRKIPLYVQILTALLLALPVGHFAGPDAAFLGELGGLLIQLIKALAAPLLFFAIVDAFLRTHVRAAGAARMVAVSAINAGLALAIGLGLANAFQPGHFLQAGSAERSVTAAEKIDFFAAFAGYVPTSLAKPFVENAIISIILIAVLIGAALRGVKNENMARGSRAHEPAEALIATCFRAFEIALTWIVRLIPLAVFGVVAKVVGLQGFAPFRGLLVYVGIVILGLTLHVIVVYQAWIAFVVGWPLKRFWQGARDAVVYALGASSSLATLPVTLKSLDRMGVSPKSARLAACVGTNLNNDGIILYEALAVILVAQASGIALTPGQQAMAALSCVVAGIGIAGVPEAGLISLSLALTTVGLPTEMLPLLLTVDWVLSRARAATNVVSDILVAVILDRFDDERGVSGLPAADPVK